MAGLVWGDSSACMAINYTLSPKRAGSASLSTRMRSRMLSRRLSSKIVETQQPAIGGETQQQNDAFWGHFMAQMFIVVFSSLAFKPGIFHCE